MSQLPSRWRARIRKWEKHSLEGKRALKSKLSRPGPPADRLRGNRLNAAKALHFQMELDLISNPFGQLKQASHHTANLGFQYSRRLLGRGQSLSPRVLGLESCCPVSTWAQEVQAQVLPLWLTQNLLNSEIIT